MHRIEKVLEMSIRSYRTLSMSILFDNEVSHPCVHRTDGICGSRLFYLKTGKWFWWSVNAVLTFRSYAFPSSTKFLLEQFFNAFFCKMITFDWPSFTGRKAVVCIESETPEIQRLSKLSIWIPMESSSCGCSFDCGAYSIARSLAVTCGSKSPGRIETKILLVVSQIQ